MIFILEKVLLFLTVLFLPTQLGLHFWPRFSNVYSLKVDYLSPTLYFWDILVVGLLIVWVSQKPHINKIALNLFLFFLFTQALSLLGATNTGAGLVRLEQYALAGLFGVYLASVIPGSRKTGLPAMTNVKFIYLPLALGILGESIIAILQFIKGGTLGLWILGERSFLLSTPGIAKFDFYGHEFLRPYATFPHPNVLAAFMLLVIVILSATKDITPKLYSSANRLRTTTGAATILLGGITIFLSMSRTAILAGFISALMLLNRKWKIILIMVVLILSPVLLTRYSSLLNFDNLTILRREELMRSAWQMFTKYPIFGVGLNNFIPAMADQLVAGPSRFLQPVHNIFLLVLSETGVIGMIGVIGLIGFPIWRLSVLLTTYCKLRTFLLSWIIILFLGMFDHYFLTLPQGYRILFLVWGLSYSMLK